MIITEAMTYGALLTIKIENMREQHSKALLFNGIPEMADMHAPESAMLSNQGDIEEFGIVAVCAGTGIEAVFRDLGADKLITGGQTMNPSTEDILEKINTTPANVVFVLPNNKNIIMAAQQCISLTDKHVVVIPTKSIPQGVSAMLAADGMSDINEMTVCMTEAAKRVRTALITKAARDSDFDGIEIKKDEYLALIDDSFAASGPDIGAVIDVVAAALSSYSPEFITIFTGEGIDDDEANAVAGRISSVLTGAETSVIHGDQPVYHFIIAAE
jgi:dihydroxyacetone kinase-like predicted kinase